MGATAADTKENNQGPWQRSAMDFRRGGGSQHGLCISPSSSAGQEGDEDKVNKDAGQGWEHRKGPDQAVEQVEQRSA